MTKQCKIAEETGISNAQISRIFNGKSEIGKGAAIKIEAVTGTPWNEIMAMPPEDIKELLTTAVTERKQSAA